MIPLPALLQQFAVRYRTALMVRVGVLAGLGLTSCGLLAWRLRALHVSATWALGLPATLAALLLAGLGWWLRRRWLNRHRAAAFLDRTLGLQQQLVTAEEFAASPGVSSLYPVLVEDLGRQLSTDQVRFPRPWDHKTGLLLAVLLLLLLWPTLNAVLPPALRLPEEQQSAASKQQSAQSQQQAQDQHQAASTQQQAQDQQSAVSSQQSAASKQQSAQSQGQDQQSATSSQQSASSSQQSAQSQGQDQHPAASTKQQAQSEDQQSAASSQQPAASKQQSAQSQGQQSGGRQSQQAPTAREGQGNQGTGQSSGEGAALKADIQQLLKEMSSELKNLQAQLEQAKDQPQPNAGTGTDPNLYNASEKMDTAAANNPIPLQLETDTAKAQRGRQGMGVGKPSGEVSDVAPAAKAQAAELSDQPLEESSASHQPVPAEYRSVFDQLQRREPQPDEPKP